MKKMNKKGFTIVELVIVIAVIAVLAAVMIPTFGGMIEKANKSAALQEATNAYKQAYALDLADGKIDYLDDGKAIELPEGFVYSAEAITYTDGEYSFTYTDNEWVEDAE